MVLVERPERHRVLPVVHLGDEAPMLVFFLQLAAFLLEGGVQRRELLPELVQRAVKEFLRDKRLCHNIFLVHLIARLAGQDDQFPHHVRTGKVNAGIRLGIPLLLRHPDGFAEGDIGRNRVEDEIQRTAQDRLDLLHVVAAVAEAVDRVDDRKTRAHVGLEQELDALAARRLLEHPVVLVVRRRRDLVRRHDGDAVIEEILIQGGDLGAGRAVHEHRIEDVHGDDFVPQFRRRDGLSLSQQLFPAGQVDPVAVEHRLDAAGDAYHVDFQVPAALELVLLEGNLLDQLPADRTHAADEQVQFLILRQEEPFVNDIQGLPEVFMLHDEGDVALRGALGQGDDADAVPAQDAEQLTGDTAAVLHVLAHDGDGGELVLPLHGIDGAARDLRRERLGQHLAGLLCIGCAYTDGNACLRGRLAYEEHVDVPARQGREDTLVHADDPHHGGGRQRDERDVVDGGDTLDHPLVLPAGPGLADERTRRLRVEGVLDPDGNLLLAYGIQGGRIHHLGAEVTQFGGFLVGQFVDDVGRLDNAGIGGHEAIDIGPNLQYRGVQGRCEDAGGVVGTAAAQGDDVTGAVAGDEAGNDGDGTSLPISGELFGDQLVRSLEVHEPAVQPDEVQRIEQLRVADSGRHDERREPLAEAQDLVPRLLRQHLQQEHAPADAVQLGQQRLHGGAQRPVAAGEGLARVQMTLPKLLKLNQIGCVGRFRQRGDPDEFVRDAAQRGHDHDHRIVLRFHDGPYLPYALGRGDGTAAEFQYFHSSNTINLPV